MGLVGAPGGLLISVSWVPTAEPRGGGASLSSFSYSRVPIHPPVWSHAADTADRGSETPPMIFLSLYSQSLQGASYSARAEWHARLADADRERIRAFISHLLVLGASWLLRAPGVGGSQSAWDFLFPLFVTSPALSLGDLASDSLSRRARACPPVRLERLIRCSAR